MFTNNEIENGKSLNNQISPLSNFPLIIKTEQSPGTVFFENYEQIKQKIKEGVDYYNSFDYSIENYNIAVKNHKELKNIKNILEKSKREITKLYDAPLKVVEKKLSELIELIKKPYSTVDNFIKINEKSVKRYNILDYSKKYAEQIGLSRHVINLINSPAFFNVKWLNATYTTSQWRGDVHLIMQNALNDINSIEKMYQDNYSIMIAQYYQTLSLESVNNFADSIKDVLRTSKAKAANSQLDTKSTQEGQDMNPSDFMCPDDSKILEALSNNINPFNNSQIMGLDNDLLNWIKELYKHNHKVSNGSDNNVVLGDVLNAFNDNVDYYTGEMIYGVSNDLKNYIFSLIESKKSKSVVNQENRGARWTKEEDEILYKEFVSGKSIGEIALLHKRNNGGISARLKKQGLIDENGNKTFE